MRIIYPLIFLSLLAGCQQDATSIDLKGDKYYGWGEENPNQASYKLPISFPHKVIAQPGQLLKEIARIYRVKPEDIMILNEINNSNYRFKTPTELVMPNYILHQVAKGETVYQLGRIYSTSPQQIIDTNEIRPPFYLKIDEIVKIYIDRVGEEKAGRTKNTHQTRQLESSVAEAPVKKVEIKPTSSISTPQALPIKNKLIQKENFNWPAQGKIIKNFGKAPNGIKHKGITLELPAKTKVKAIASGKVVYIGDDIPGFGNTIIIKHYDNWFSTYAHHQGSFINMGDIVEKGEIIAQTADYPSSQLYLSIKKDRKYVNPLKLLKN